LLAAVLLGVDASVAVDKYAAACAPGDWRPDSDAEASETLGVVSSGRIVSSDGVFSAEVD
jgi:hypothetical protein